MSTPVSERLPTSTTLAVLGALGASLFFHGRWLAFLCLALTFEILALLAVLWRGDRRFILPRSMLTLILSLFWVWLGLTLIWTPVPATSTLNFWWLGSLPLIYWVSILEPEPQAYWRVVFPGLLAIALGLAVFALYQFFALHSIPRSVFLYANSQDALLNLLILPVCAYLLNAIARRQRKTAYGLAGLVVTLAFVIALTGERAPAVTLIVGLVVLAWYARRLVPPRVLALPFGLVAAAYGLAAMAARGAPLARLASMAHPDRAAATRTVIWRGAFALLAHAPWHGIGLGLFSLAYPPYRHYSDTSAGFFAHDDYLQIAIEAGWIGLALFLILIGTVAATFMRALPPRGTDDARRIEMAGLFAALVTVAVHSLVDFNFYIPAILVCAGLLLGRLHTLALDGEKPVIRCSLEHVLSRGGYRSMLVLAALVPIAGFAAMGLADHDYRVGLAAATRGDWLAANRAFVRAQGLFPDSDTIRMTRADLYRHLLLDLPPSDPGERARVYRSAKELLAQAHARNPLRPETVWLQGEIDSEHPHLTGAHWFSRAVAHDREALALDPRFYPARFDLAELMLHRNHRRQALVALTAGLRYWYPQGPRILPYYGLSAALLRAEGHLAWARRITHRVHGIERAFPTNAMSRKIVLLGRVPEARGWDVP
ncbi:MAG: O-antigen ligase family protein [Acidiferrobacteraceae bacterium]